MPEIMAQTYEISAKGHHHTCFWGPFTSTPNYPLRHPKYHLVETIRPLIEVHWGVHMLGRSGGKPCNRHLCARTTPCACRVRSSRRLCCQYCIGASIIAINFLAPWKRERIDGGALAFPHPPQEEDEEEERIDVNIYIYIRIL